jgi:hypothetical protein
MRTPLAVAVLGASLLSLLASLPVGAASAGRVRADCLVQSQVNANWCPAAAPRADVQYHKHPSAYDFRHGINSPPAAAAGAH